MSAQLSFTIGHEPSYARADFIESECNREALAFVERWPDWPSYGLIIYGPNASGKTHLAHIFTQRANGRFLKLHDLKSSSLFVTLPSQASLVLDDYDPSTHPEQNMFHLLNMEREEKGSILIVANSHPSTWPVYLPDLRSRFLALPAVAIATPDEELLKAVMTKLFADRQLVVEPGVIDYAILRLERSFDAIHRFVDQIDDVSLREKRNITLPLARQILPQIE